MKDIPVKNHRFFLSRNKKNILLCIVAFVLFTYAQSYPLYPEAHELYKNKNPYDLTQETYSFTEIWSTPAQNTINFLPQSYNSPVATRNGVTFVLFVDTTHRIKITKIDETIITEAFIDNTIYQSDEFYINHDSDSSNDHKTPDYYRVKLNDGHHSVALGIDELGYIHLVADMHNYPRYIEPQKHLPLKYVNQHILYWRSKSPLDINEFVFMGNKKEESPQGTGFTYPFFFNDMYGQLHFVARAHQETALRAIPFSRYNSKTGTWAIIGDTVSGEPNHPRTFYDDGREYNDLKPDQVYSKSHPHGIFGRDNTLHMVAPLLDNPTRHPVIGGTHFANTIVYAQSSNGFDYTKASGEKVILPATIDLTSNRADIPYQTSGFIAVSGVIATDYQGNPYTIVKEKFFDGSSSHTYLIGWEGAEWKNYGELVSSQSDFRLVHDPAGVLNYIPDSNNKLYRFWKPTDSLHIVKLPWTIRVIDYEYLKATGNIMGIAKIENKLTLVKVTIGNRPLDESTVKTALNPLNNPVIHKDEKYGIYTLSGRKVHDVTLSNKEIGKTVKNLKLSPGVYFLRSTTFNGKILIP